MYDDAFHTGLGPVFIKHLRVYLDTVMVKEINIFVTDLAEKST